MSYKPLEMNVKFFIIENPAQKASLYPSQLATETYLLKVDYLHSFMTYTVEYAPSIHFICTIPIPPYIIRSKLVKVRHLLVVAITIIHDSHSDLIY